MFYADAFKNEVGVLDAETLLARPLSGGSMITYAADPDRLFIGSEEATQVQVVDGTSGTPIAVLSLEQRAAALNASRDGSRLLVYGRAASGPTFVPQYLALYDTASATVLARSASIDGTGPGLIQWDEERSTIYVSLNNAGQVAAIDGSSLAAVSVVPVDGPPYDDTGRFRREFKFLPGRDAMGGYVLRWERWFAEARCERLALEGYDARRSARRVGLARGAPEGRLFWSSGPAPHAFCAGGAGGSCRWRACDTRLAQSRRCERL